MRGPKRRKSKEEIKEIADRAEAKKTRKKASALEPPAADEELEEYPGGVIMRKPRHMRGGRPTLYKPEYATIATAMVKRGATIAEIAELFGVSNRTIHLWQQTHDDFMRAFMQLDEAYDARIERSLAERALGYTYDAVKVFQYQGQPVIVPYREHVPPDLTAIRLWLANRKPEQWKEKQEVEVSANDAFVEIWKKLGEKKGG